MSKRLSNLLVEDIIESSNKILEYTEGLTFDQFISDSKTIDAVIRNFEIIGEATSRLPAKFKNNYPEIDWHKIRGFRNRIVHDYFGIDYSIVWEIKNNFLPAFIQKLKNIDF